MADCISRLVSWKTSSCVVSGPNTASNRNSVFLPFSGFVTVISSLVSCTHCTLPLAYAARVCDHRE